MFKIYTKEVEFTDASGETGKYTLLPLSGDWLPALYKVIKKLQVEEGETMDEDAMGEFHSIALETFKKSYPEEDEINLNLWVSQNLMKLVEPVMEVNLGNPNVE